MKTFFSTRVIACCAAGILLFSHPIYGQTMGSTIPEETAAPSPLQEKATIELLADDIIDAIEYSPQIINADGKIESLPMRTRFYYAGDPVQDTVIQDGDDYSSIKLVNDRYYVYTSDVFVHDATLGQWRTIENKETDPAIYEAVMLERMDPTLGDLLSGTFKPKAVLAQEDPIYSAAGDGYVAHFRTGNWATAHDATDGTHIDYTGTLMRVGCDPYSPPNTYSIWRDFLGFDTSSLSGTAVDITLNISVSGINGNGSGNNAIVSASQSSISTLALSDYDLISTDEISDRFTVTTTGAKSIPLYDDSITLGGDVKLAVRNASDLDNTACDTYVTFDFYPSEQSGTTDDPYLELTIQAEPPAATSTPQASTTPNYIDFENVLILYMVGGLLLIFLLGALYAIWPTSNY